MSKLLQSDSSSSSDSSTEEESVVDLDDLLTDLDSEGTPYVPTTENEKTRVATTEQDEDSLPFELEDFLSSLDKRDKVFLLFKEN